jgi:hypothetical protein
MIKGLAKSRTARAMALKPSLLTRASGNSLSGYSPMMSELYHTPSERFFAQNPLLIENSAPTRPAG